MLSFLKPASASRSVSSLIRLYCIVSDSRFGRFWQTEGSMDCKRLFENMRACRRGSVGKLVIDGMSLSVKSMHSMPCRDG